MADRPKKPSRSAGSGPARRQDRLAAALKANLARRKAQARERAEAPAAAEKPERPSTDPAATRRSRRKSSLRRAIYALEGICQFLLAG